jgi:hypothetical protein
MGKGRWLLIVSVVALLERLRCDQLVIPLAYAFDPATQSKYPIRLSFNHSETFLPFAADFLPLFNFNISMDTQRLPADATESFLTQSVIIGVKWPSTFLSAVMATFQVERRQIEFGKEEYTELIIDGNNFVESRDEFVNGDNYTVKAVYNFGDALFKAEQRCFLIDDANVYFDEFLILEILNSMEPKNGIRYSQDASRAVINLTGAVENFPHISFMRGQSIFEVRIESTQIRYIPRANSSQPTTVIGFRAFRQFSKFEVDAAAIVFKRTAQLYQLYVFLGYFFVGTVGFLLLSRAKLEESMLFVRSVISWILCHNRQARLRVLRTELE